MQNKANLKAILVIKLLARGDKVSRSVALTKATSTDHGKWKG